VVSDGKAPGRWFLETKRELNYAFQVDSLIFSLEKTVVLQGALLGYQCVNALMSNDKKKDTLGALVSKLPMSIVVGFGIDVACVFTRTVLQAGASKMLSASTARALMRDPGKAADRLAGTPAGALEMAGVAAQASLLGHAAILIVSELWDIALFLGRSRLAQQDSALARSIVARERREEDMRALERRLVGHAKVFVGAMVLTAAGYSVGALASASASKNAGFFGSFILYLL